ncbi:DUF2339 domain-containing protein [Rhodoflexus sp.]
MPDTPENIPPQDAPQTPSNDGKPLAEQINRFVSEVLANREAIQKAEGIYNPITQDEEYKLLYEKGLHEAIKDYDISHYPFYVPPRRRLQNEKREEADSQSIDWKKIEQKVYLKAFTEPEDDLEEQIHTISQKSSIPYEKTRQLILERLAKGKNDFERFIYEDVFSKIAVLIFTIGIGMLIRYGIAEGVLPEWARISIGMLISGILFAIAKRMENSNQTFSLLFATSALCLMFYTNYLAFREYNFLNQFAAFALMLCIISISLGLSLYYNRRYFAVLAIVGAYLTPFVIVGEQINYNYFFSYLFVITLSTIVIAYRRRWILLNYLTFITTMVILTGWMWRVNLGSLQMLYTGMTFSTLFYLVYFGMHLLHSLRQLRDETEVAMSERDLFFFALNMGFFILSVYRLLGAHFLVGEYFGWWLVGTGIFNGAFGWWLYNKPDSNYNIRKYMQAFALGGVSIGMLFICQTRHTLHLAWLAETFALLLIARYWRVPIFRDAAVLTFLASLITLFSIWYSTYNGSAKPDFLFNSAVFATIASVCIYIGGLFLVQMQAQATEGRLMFLTYEAKALQGLLAGVSIGLIYLSGNIELTYHRFSHPDLERLVIGIYNTIFAILFWVGATRTANKRLQLAANYILMAAVISYIVFAHPKVINLRNEFLIGTAKPTWFFVHYINLILDLLAIYLLLSYQYGIFSPLTKQAGNNDAEEDSTTLRIDYVVWLACGSLVFHLTAELDHLYVVFFYDADKSFAKNISYLLEQTRLFFYPILWSLIAFGIMLLGVQYRIRDFRIIASALLGAMLLKLLAYDIWKVSRFTQILLLIIIGGLLFIVSYLNTQLRSFLAEGTLDIDEIYQKLTGKKSAPPPQQPPSDQQKP